MIFIIILIYFNKSAHKKTYDWQAYARWKQVQMQKVWKTIFITSQTSQAKM